MADIVIADGTNAYDARSAAERPLGGTETSVIRLAEALARRGHAVRCLTNGATGITHAGVRWDPLGAVRPDGCDLLVAVQHPRLLAAVRRPRRRVLWVVWPPQTLGRWREAVRLWLRRPRYVFASEYQARTFPRHLPPPRPRIVIPLGLPDEVRGRPPLAAPPPPRAVFASNPVRNLSWLIGLWARRILPAVPGAELHVHGIRDYAYRYGAPWEESERRLGRFIPPEAGLAARRSLRPHPPLPQERLWDAMRASRVMLYGGHRAEAFCLAAAEAQALGVPAVLRPLAVLPERVRDRETGFLAADDEAFAAAAVTLLTDDALWRRQHAAALALQQGWSWDEMAARFDEQVATPR